VVETDVPSAQALSEATGLSLVTAGLLVSRGVRDPEAAGRFLHPDLERDWRDPDELPGMPEAADAVAAAIEARARIVVFGDFDADGITAAAVVYRGLAELGAQVEVDLPHRFDDGYGLTQSSVDRLVALAPDLVITVDNGISSAEEVRALLAAGIDVVVTDHHEPGELVPEGVPVVDPKLGGYHFQGLAGAGVALKLVQAVGGRLGRPGLHEQLTDIAAVGTLADVVSVLDENRALIAHGLERIRRDPRPGLRALAEEAGVDVVALTSDNVVFALVPRLNASGRVADPRVGFDLLVTDEPVVAHELARELDGYNRVRREAEQELLDRAAVEAEERAGRGAPLLLLAGEAWHEGVRGIVASRLARRFGLPTLIFTIEDETARGSGRSVPGLDLHALLSAHEELFVRFGGHDAAVGVTLPRDALGELDSRLTADLQAAGPVRAPRIVDFELELESVSDELVAELALLEPFGEGNRRPVFGTRGVFLSGRRRVGKDGSHLLFDAFDGVRSVPAVAFRCPDVESAVEHEASTDVAYELERDEYRGRARTRLIVRELLMHDGAHAATAAAELLDDLFERAPAILAGGEYEGIGDAASFHTKLAGVTFEGRQDVIAALEPGLPLRIDRQPDNPHDPNACALHGPDGRQVGFFNRRLAAVLAPLLDDGLDLDVTVADVTGGGDGESLGVNVLVERRDGGDAAVEIARERRAELERLAPAALDASLCEHFIGGRTLRDAQAQALGHLAEGRGCLTVMATGRGKSLIFHLHAARLAISSGRASVFVFPLRALVADQSFHLSETLAGIGVACTTLTGETPPGRRDEVFAGIADGTVEVVLTTPEFLELHAARFANAERIGFVVVDEAHHVGLARAGRRPAYARMGEVLAALGHPVPLAVTATAGDDVAETIVATLGTNEFVLDPAVRDNLVVEDRRGAGDKAGYLAALVARGDKAVVYVNSREQSVRIAERLRAKVPGLANAIGFYNGGVGRAARHAIEHAFRDGDIRVVVATSAFGEGVDVPDVRHVVHYHLPFNDIEFNQMSGRAGRDGETARIHLLFGEKDARLNQLILESVAPSRDDMAQLYVVLRGLQEAVEDAFEATNAELAGEVVERRPSAKLSERGVSTALGVFRELGLVESEGAGSYRRLRVPPPPGERLDLTSSARYREGLEEQAGFSAFKEWVLTAPAAELLERFDRPILPAQMV
jgi:single-stranded-DNA-specific exonuclease